MSTDRQTVYLFGVDPTRTVTNYRMTNVITPPDIDGACAGHVGIDWTPRTRGEAKEALALCALCPLTEKRKCAQYAVDTQPEGVWGGVYIRSRTGREQDYESLAHLAKTGRPLPVIPIDELKKQAKAAREAKEAGAAGRPKSLRCRRGHKRAPETTGSRGNCLICEKESRQGRRAAKRGAA